MDNEQTRAEKRIMQQGTNQAVNLLTITFTRQALQGEREKGSVLVISDKRYARIKVDGSLMCNNLEGEPLPSDYEDFLLEELTDPSCIGLVPLTEKAYDLIKGGLKGTPLLPKEYCKVLYSV